jgi:hypothetical protein
MDKVQTNVKESILKLICELNTLAKRNDEGDGDGVMFSIEQLRGIKSNYDCSLDEIEVLGPTTYIITITTWDKTKE